MSAPRRAAPGRAVSNRAEPPARDLGPEQEIAPGRSLVRVGADRGASLAERVVAQLQRLTWRTPLHSLRLHGRFPLKLLGVPRDPVAGDAHAGAALIGGEMLWGALRVDVEDFEWTDRTLGAGFVDHLQAFAWLRDLPVAGPREVTAPVAEAMMRRWLATYANRVDDTAWRPDLWGRRILAWTFHAPLILSSDDLVYRSAVLNALARGARHLDRAAENAATGVPRIAAYAGLIAAGLLIPGGEPRIAIGEQGLARALRVVTTLDGGVASRSPAELLDLVELLSCLLAIYEERRRDAPADIAATLSRSVPALLGVTLGDGALSSWQGGGPLDPARVARVVTGSGIRTRPQRQSRDWGFQRMAAGQSVVVIDCAPPPASRLARGGCASTLAFELADGPRRIVVNCGGGQPWDMLPREIAAGLRTTAAHSTLVLADSNSTAIHADGSLGRGVTEVELDRQEQENASRIEASHDGYAKRFGFTHRRRLSLGADGRELAGEDVLLPAGGTRPGPTVGFALRFHLAPGVEATATADGMAALLRVEGGEAWHYRCRGGALTIEPSLSIDRAGRPVPTSQLVVSGEAPAGGATVAWAFKRAA